MAAAETVLGVEFNDKEMLKVALTHSSFAYEVGSAEFNEKLEFLGDSVLGLVVTEEIFARYPSLQEGALAKMRANLVRAEMLSKLAHQTGLGQYLFMGRGAEQSGGRENGSILADCYEAIIGAIYLDRGYGEARSFVLGALEDEIADQGRQKELADPKTALQELTMERWSILPDYSIVAQEGPAHKPIFVAEVRVHQQIFGRGVGTSKKKAEQLAAKEALKEISKLEF